MDLSSGTISGALTITINVVAAMPVRLGIIGAEPGTALFPNLANGSMKAATFIPGRILMGFQSKIVLGELEPVGTAALVIRGLWKKRTMRAAAPRKIAAAQRARWAGAKRD